MSLQVWLPLNGDLKSYGLSNVTVVNSGATVDNNGKIGKCYEFDGTDDYINTGFGSNHSAKNLSVALWIKPLSSISSKIVIGCANGSNRRFYVGVRYDTYVLAFGSEAWSGSSNAPATVGVWAHIVATVDNTGKMNLYYNGGLTNKTITSQTGDFNLASNIYVGGRTDGYNANCLINDVRIYDHCLSPKEIKELSKGIVCNYKFDDFSPEYQELEYIQSSGTQHINTNIKWKSGYSIKLDFTSISNSGNYCLFGASNGSAYNNGEVSCFWYNNKFDRVIPTSNTTSINGKFNYYLENTRYILTYNSQETKAISFNTTYSLSNSSFYNDYIGNNNIFLFATNRNGGKYNSAIKVHSFQILNENNILIQLLVPVKRKSDNAIGMYDLVTNTFFENDGTGDFTAGPVTQQNNTVTDTSGYKYDGTMTGNVSTNTNSPRYNRCTEFITNTTSVQTPIYPNINNDSVSFGAWFKFNKNEIATVLETMTQYDVDHTASTGNLIGNDQFGGIGLIWLSNKIYNDGTINPFTTLRILAALRTPTNSNKITGNYTISFDTWTHIFLTFDKVTNLLCLYINGTLSRNVQNTAFNDAPDRNICVNYPAVYAGSSHRAQKIPFHISDLRYYATALSEQDIKDLYNKAASIDNEGSIYSFEFIENELLPKINKKGIASSKDFFEYPDEYELYDYIQSDGNQWIDTGYAMAFPSDGYLFKADMSISPQINIGSGTENYISGSITGNKYSGCFIRQVSLGANPYVVFGNSSSTNRTETSFSNIVVSNKDIVEFNFKNSGRLLYNNIELNFNINSIAHTATWTLFSINGRYKGAFKLYYYKISHNNVIVRDMIPAKRISDNAIGMWDRVNNQFYSNAGTGTFTLGSPDLPQASIYRDKIKANQLIEI